MLCSGKTVVVVVVLGLCAAARGQDALRSKCQADFQKLTDCMDYATGHTGAPSGTCCDDTASIQKARPECLCYIIQQVHNGQHEVQSLGLRFDRLLSMPTACKLSNANVTKCIYLLHLTPSSPDYSVFANSSKITPSSITPASAGSSSDLKVQMTLHCIAFALVSAVFSSIF